MPGIEPRTRKPRTFLSESGQNTRDGSPDIVSQGVWSNRKRMVYYSQVTT